MTIRRRLFNLAPVDAAKPKTVHDLLDDFTSRSNLRAALSSRFFLWGDFYWSSKAFL
jgi:hypothetical protein